MLLGFGGGVLGVLGSGVCLGGGGWCTSGLVNCVMSFIIGLVFGFRLSGLGLDLGSGLVFSIGLVLRTSYLGLGSSFLGATSSFFSSSFFINFTIFASLTGFRFALSLARFSFFSSLIFRFAGTCGRFGFREEERLGLRLNLVLVLWSFSTTSSTI